LLYMGFHQRRVVVDFVELYLLRFAQAAKPEQEAQAKNHRGMPLFELNSLPLPHGRQRIIDVSPYGATKGRA